MPTSYWIEKNTGVDPFKHDIGYGFDAGGEACTGGIRCAGADQEVICCRLARWFVENTPEPLVGKFYCGHCLHQLRIDTSGAHQVFYRFRGTNGLEGE